MIEGTRSYLFFPGIEADCGTEPVEANGPERSSIAKKFAAYLAIAEQASIAPTSASRISLCR